jgi:lipopolysaccharide/colanic/teichoic acid biosynthesis glycosyltransferase
MGSTTFYARFGKRMLDVVVGGAALIALTPVLLILSTVVRFGLGGPVLFRQLRPGLAGRTFRLAKFRTMTDARDAHGHLLPDSQRLGRLGKWLRASSLDELPELIHVVRGEMSLVGPRPLLPQYLGLYDARQARRHDVRPGLTGMAQVSGRNALDWPSRLELDVQYVERMTFALDLRVLCRTVAAVLRRDGINAAGEVTVQEFRGKEFRRKEAA